MLQSIYGVDFTIYLLKNKFNCRKVLNEIFFNFLLDGHLEFRSTNFFHISFTYANPRSKSFYLSKNIYIYILNYEGYTNYIA